jgi:hypothetical protein
MMVTEGPPRTESLCEEIVYRVADAKEVDPLELHPPLYFAIDPEALERLYEMYPPSRRPPSVTFTYCGQIIQIHNDRCIEILPLTATEGGT